jgi:pimeloyl-ACP methyl ester carboxylesterase
MKLMRILALLLLLLGFGASAQTLPNDLYVYRADGMLIKLDQHVHVNDKHYYLYNEPGWSNRYNKKQNMWAVATILGKNGAKAITQTDRSAFMRDRSGNGYTVRLPSEGELRAIFSSNGRPPTQWETDALDGCCEYWSATVNWNDHSTVTMWNNNTQARWDTDERVVALEVTPSAAVLPEPPPAKVLLLHGLFGAGDSIMGSSYFPDLPGWIKEKTGQAPVIPNLRDGTLESQYGIAEAYMRDDCVNGCRWHIVGHSRGGLVARMVLARHPDWVASITTVASPHRGCALCDFTADNKWMKDFIALFTSTGAPDQIIEMSQANMAKFNQKYPIGVSDGVDWCEKFQYPPTDYFHSKLGMVCTKQPLAC